MKISIALDPNPENIESVCRIGNVVFDQTNGMGETPNNRNVIYKGFAALMPCSKFLELVAPANRDEDAAKIASRIENGESIASPFIELDLNGFMTAIEEEDPNIPIPEVVGHEGRGRVFALMKLNHSKHVLVHVFASHFRARHFDDVSLRLLNDNGLYQEKSKKLITKPFDTIFWRGTRLELKVI